MPGLVFIFGKCVWAAPSAQAAFAFLAMFYGMPPIAPEAAQATLVASLVASGETEIAAQADLRWMNHCFTGYIVPENMRNWK